MTVFLLVIGILGILVSSYNLYGAAQYIAVQWHSYGQAAVHPNTVWQLNTLPWLSTIFIFALKHWIFAIPILFSLIQVLSMMLLSKREDEMASFPGIVFPGVAGWVGRGGITLGSAIILTLSLTRQNTGIATLLSWYFPVLIIAFWGATWIANMIFGWLVGVLARFMSK